MKRGLLTASLFGAGLITTLTLYGGGLAYLGQITGISTLSTWLMLAAGIITYAYGLHRIGLVKIPAPSYSGTPGFMKNRGDFAAKLDFEKLLFEKHELEIVIEPKLPYDTNKFVFGDS